MRKGFYHPLLKTLALTLAALTFGVALLSGVAVVCMVDMGAYYRSKEDFYEEKVNYLLGYYAEDLLVRTAREKYSNAPQGVYENFTGGSYYWDDFVWNFQDRIRYTVTDSQGDVLESTFDPNAQYESGEFSYGMDDVYYLMCEAEKTGTDDHGNGDAEETRGFLGTYFDDSTESYLRVYRRNAGDMRAELYLLPGTREELIGYYQSRNLECLLLDYGYDLPWICGLNALGFLVLFVYLCLAAGRSQDTGELKPGGLNRIPLDLYGIAVGFGGTFLCALAVWILQETDYSRISDPRFLRLAIAGPGVLFYLTCLLGFLFLFAFAAQVKMPKAYWWTHSVTGFLLTWIWKLCKTAVRAVRRAVSSLISVVPVAWRWILIGFCGVLGLIITGIIACTGGPGVFFAFLVFLGSMAIVVYSGWCFGRLLQGAKRMASGELNRGVDSKYMVFSYKEFADSLNGLGDAAKIAAQKQLKSERMKTELITNVSHDIKTPLTSIINYVDLMQRTESSEERTQYLEVLSRQSQRLKKLIEDLMDMSKASTGNMTVNLADVDAAETVRQSLGEFADKLALADLTVVELLPEEPVMAYADGRLLWRVMSNLLGNVVKYAQPGTRVYVNVFRDGRDVKIFLRNISRDPLNISADELMERFVRGDASRNTEGSGLGLNIAKNLLELQNGSLELTVDGDLFKAVVTIPGSAQ